MEMRKILAMTHNSQFCRVSRTIPAFFYGYRKITLENAETINCEDAPLKTLPSVGKILSQVEETCFIGHNIIRAGLGTQARYFKDFTNLGRSTLEEPQ